MYSALKYTHMFCAITSIAGFVLRGYWMMTDSPLRSKKLVKILPHVIDTLLLAAGITLAVTINQYPGTHNWLSAKVAGLILYIILGLFALRLGKTKTVRTVAFVAAVLVFGYVYGVAMTHNPWGWLTSP